MPVLYTHPVTVTIFQDEEGHSSPSLYSAGYRFQYSKHENTALITHNSYLVSMTHNTQRPVSLISDYIRKNNKYSQAVSLAAIGDVQ